MLGSVAVAVDVDDTQCPHLSPTTAPKGPTITQPTCPSLYCHKYTHIFDIYMYIYEYVSIYMYTDIYIYLMVYILVYIYMHR